MLYKKRKQSAPKGLRRIARSLPEGDDRIRRARPKPRAPNPAAGVEASSVHIAPAMPTSTTPVTDEARPVGTTAMSAMPSAQQKGVSIIGSRLPVRSTSSPTPTPRRVRLRSGPFSHGDRHQPSRCHRGHRSSRRGGRDAARPAGGGAARADKPADAAGWLTDTICHLVSGLMIEARLGDSVEPVRSLKPTVHRLLDLHGPQATR